MIETNSHPALHREATRLPPQGWRGKTATSAWLIQLLRGLIDGERAHAGPFYAELSTTTLCNQGCLGCQYHSSANRGPLYSAKGTDHIRLDYVKKLCAGLQRLGTREIILTGEGEPLFHPQLLDIISLCKAAGLYVHLFTNGTLLDETMAAHLIDSGLDILRVSLWAASLEEYEKCYPGVDPGNFQSTLDAVRMLSNLKAGRQTPLPVVVLTGPLNRHNQKGIGARIRLAGEIGADAVTFTPFRAWSGEFSTAALSPAEIDAVCEDLAQSRGLLDSLGLSHNLDEAIQRFRFGEAFLGDLPCYIGWFHTQVTVDGTVVPCGACPIPLGNLGDSSFEDIWNGARYKAFRARTMVTRRWALGEKDCNCIYCCFTRLNVRVHRYFRWLAPLLGRQL
jgi:MoaA/NifB/PqqE/SkfB family radical SAM enzyme